MPIANGASPAETAAAEPPEEPPTDPLGIGGQQHLATERRVAGGISPRTRRELGRVGVAEVHRPPCSRAR